MSICRPVSRGLTWSTACAGCSAKSRSTSRCCASSSPGRNPQWRKFARRWRATCLNTAERLAHTLKGVSGTIGATGLQGLAEKLETAIRERRPREEIDARLDELKMPLAYLLTQLEQQLPEERGKTAVTVDPEQLKAVCDKLAAMLADDDAEAVDVLDANADLLNAAFPRPLSHDRRRHPVIRLRGGAGSAEGRHRDIGLKGEQHGRTRFHRKGHDTGGRRHAG